MAGEFPCLVCDVALSEIQKRGLSELAFVLRRIADELWTDLQITTEEKKAINNHLAALMRLLFCPPGEKNAVLNDIVVQLNSEIGQESPLSESWLELKELVSEARATY